VVLVSCLPVVTLGFGASLTHLLRDSVAGDVPEAVSIPALDDVAETVAQPVPDSVSTTVPEAVAGTVARRARRRPVNGYAKMPERKYAADLAEGRLPSLRAVMRDIGVGQNKAREVRAHLASLITRPEAAACQATPIRGDLNQVLADCSNASSVTTLSATPTLDRTHLPSSSAAVGLAGGGSTGQERERRGRPAESNGDSTSSRRPASDLMEQGYRWKLTGSTEQEVKDKLRRRTPTDEAASLGFASRGQ
jgi:hypothetical protein